MNIYIDFDRTLFNTNDFFQDMDNILEKYNIPLDLFFRYVKKSDKGFNPREILLMMEKEYKVDNHIFDEIDKLMNNCDKYLYSDSKGFLKEIKKKNRVIILTKGDSDFQLEKIRKAGILDDVDSVLVTLKLKGELDLDYEHSIFVDDNPKEIKSILTKQPYKIFRIERPNNKYNDIKLEGDYEVVHELNEIIL